MFLTPTSDGEYFISGLSGSKASGDKSDNDNCYDYWIIKEGNGPASDCFPPSDLQVYDITNSSAIVSWADAGADYYKVGYKPDAGGKWIAVKNDSTGVKIYDTQVEISGLIPATTYRWRVTSHCDDKTPEDGVPGQKFTTDAFRFADNGSDLLLLHVFPNPCILDLNIGITNSNDEVVMLKIYDLTGNAVFERNEINDALSSVIRVHLEELPSGIYFLEARSGHEVSRVKIMVER